VELRIGGNEIEQEGARHIADALKTNEVIDLKLPSSYEPD
jgi:hypothetical protein